MNKDIPVVHTCKYKNVVERIRQDELVKAKISDMPPFPENCNPFRHDSFSMGTELPRSWMVMTSGFDSVNGHEDFYLVNTRTGQRLHLDFEAKTPRYEEDVYISENHGLSVGQAYVWYRNYEEVNWVTYLDALSADPEFDKEKVIPIYVIAGKRFVRMDIVVDDAKFADWIQRNEPEPADLEQLTRFMTSYKTTYAELRG